MATQRLINCDFFIKGGFDSKLSNNAKLLYFYLLINADDMGFVGNADKIIEELNKDNSEDDALIPNDFNAAADDLISHGFLYRFMDNYNNQTLLIRHWFMHNKWQKFLRTNFTDYLSRVRLVNSKYSLIESNILNKTNKTNKQINKLSNDISSLNNSNNDDTNKEEGNKDWEKDWDKFLADINQCGKPVNKGD